jgi:hypothetical protein
LGDEQAEAAAAVFRLFLDLPARYGFARTSGMNPGSAAMLEQRY